MVIIKKIDDIGRIAIPRDVRRALRWMGGDEIEIIPKDNGELILRKRQNDTIPVLNELRQELNVMTLELVKALLLIAKVCASATGCD